LYHGMPSLGRTAANSAPTAWVVEKPIASKAVYVALMGMLCMMRY
jgi:hypothetical protein